jgi:hypothetical protein
MSRKKAQKTPKIQKTNPSSGLRLRIAALALWQRDLANLGDLIFGLLSFLGGLGLASESASELASWPPFSCTSKTSATVPPLSSFPTGTLSSTPPLRALYVLCGSMIHQNYDISILITTNNAITIPTPRRNLRFRRSKSENADPPGESDEYPRESSPSGGRLM